VWEWFLHSSVLERTDSDLSNINWFCGVILLISIVLVPWGRFPLCHTPIKPISTFRDLILILIVGHVTTWSRGSHQHLSKNKIEIMVIWNLKVINLIVKTNIAEHIRQISLPGPYKCTASPCKGFG
jgi:hypothetical protein